MPDPVQAERLQPCLLDRLTDDQPEDRHESRTARVISPSRYRDAVMRDVRWLFNTSTRLASEDLTDFPEVATSVLSYGIRDLCGRITTSVDIAQLERELTSAMNAFEPRVIPGSLHVRANQSATGSSPSILSFEIQAELWANPVPEHLFIKTEIDLETGHCQL
ncbi:MAG TPA: type VI secretion system baseplate subunit TssE [Chthoniobacter sp.]|jgi:type VI secretion system protein ImpF